MPLSRQQRKAEKERDKRRNATRHADKDSSAGNNAASMVSPMSNQGANAESEQADSKPEQSGFLEKLRGIAKPAGVIICALGSAYYGWLQMRANVEPDPARIEVRLPTNSSEKVLIRQFFVNRGNLTAEQLSVHTIAIFVPHARDTSDLILPEQWNEGDPIHANNVVPAMTRSIASLPKDGSVSTISTAAVGRGPGELDPNLLFRLRNAADDAEILALARITYRDAFFVTRTKYSCLIWRPSEPKAVAFCGRWNN